MHLQTAFITFFLAVALFGIASLIRARRTGRTAVPESASEASTLATLPVQAESAHDAAESQEEQQPEPQPVAHPVLPISDKHPLPSEAQAERDRFIQNLLSPQPGAESTEQTLAAGSNITKAAAMLRRCFPKLVVRDTTTMAEVQRDAGAQAVIEALERLHQRGKV